MTTQSPDQSLTQSPAPSKEMEERLALQLADEVWHAIRGQVEWPLTKEAIVGSAQNMLREFAAELGKEREAEDAGLIRQIKLRNEEIESLKRELAEANSSIETWRLVADKFEEDVKDASTKLAEAEKEKASLYAAGLDSTEELLALSASYQRQNEALKTVIASAFPNKREHPRMYAAWKLAEAALAETPDASLWQSIESAPKEIVKQPNIVSRFGKRILVLTSKGVVRIARWWEPIGCAKPQWITDANNEVQPTHWQPLPPPPTLQPDHQK